VRGYLFTGVAAAALIGAPLAAQQRDGEPQRSDEAESAQQSEDGKAAENSILVTGRAQQLYRIEETSTLKLPTDPLDTPLVITSINEQLIEDQGARDAQDLYRNISGVSLFSYAGVTARGFRQEEIFFDGLRGDPYVGFNVPQLFNIERVDFLKGPAGMLYGPGSPGGLFNYVTKKPQFAPQAEAQIIFGNRNRFGGSAELTGPLTSSIAARGSVFYEDQQNFRFNADERTFIADAGLTFDLDIARLTLQAFHIDQDQQGNRLRGVPVDDDGKFLVTRDWNHNERSDFLDLRSTNLQALVDGEIGDAITWNAAFRYTDANQEQEYHEPRALIDTGALIGMPDGEIDLVGREFRDQSRDEEQYTAGVNAIWSADLGPIENRVLVGYEYFDGTLDFVSGGVALDQAMIQRFLLGQSRPSDIIPLLLSDDPNYGQTRPQAYNRQFSPVRTTKQKRQGAYILEEATIGPIILVGGVRFDSFEDETGGQVFEDEEVTLRAGAVYKPREDISLFAQWAQSYEPQSVGNQSPLVGGPFPPTEGEIVEGGVKTSLMDGKFRSTLTAYEITRTNILQPLLDESGNRVDQGGDMEFDVTPLGEVTSRGVEFDVIADITPDWVFTLAYAYNDTKITETSGTTSGIGNSVGDRFANAPEHQLGIWTRYQVRPIRAAFALGMDYVDDRVSLSGQPVNEYTVFDASIIWTPGPVEVLLRVDNIFDKVYAESGFLTRTGHFPGEPRTVFVELGVSF